jgi:protein-L-isoaspartate O-methyltransferase
METKPVNRVIAYIPEFIVRPPWLVDVPTAWTGAESILFDIMKRFKIKPHCALEFGVDYGYSTSALANCFNLVIGVDTFEGDVHAGPRENLFEKAQVALKDFKNVQLVKQDYREWIAMPQPVEKYDAIHVDIVHYYAPTNELLAWAVQHSDVVLAHDSISFPEVRRAIQDVCWETGRVFYEWQVGPGLGMLVKE